ncbi:RNA polymerase sigma factor [Phenylobacterium sp.]|jgi:RNA polymerase sigma-70 factor (ECF subfamily)|uniref:RNA polymerase sigma factor n=1 Tax=Phenylobacterium sp. TaxID=1871053 RepID=UPI002F41EBB1
MSRDAERILDEAVRAAGDRIRAALAMRFRDLDLAEEAFAFASLRAMETWSRDGPPRDPAAWLYSVGRRRAFDLGRRAQVRNTAVLDEPAPQPDPETLLIAAFEPIPDERLRLIFVCCHPALAPEARIALTLRTLCGLSVERIARAWLTSEVAMTQRLTRAKRKLRETAVRFEIPAPDAWGERLETVLATLEIAYAQAYEDAALASDAADLAAETLRLTGLLANLLPDEPEVLGLAALVRLTEARRPARIDAAGAMIPLSEQDVGAWDRRLIREAAAHMRRAAELGHSGPYQLMAAIHATHAARMETGVTAWGDVVQLYDMLLSVRPSVVAQVNRAVALGEAETPEAGLAALAALGDEPRLLTWLPYQAARAGLFAKAGRDAEAAEALRAALQLQPAPAERLFLAGRLGALSR